jgi:hypothetical protein
MTGMPQMMWIQRKIERLVVSFMAELPSSYGDTA